MPINEKVSNLLFSRLGNKILALKELALQYMPTISLTLFVLSRTGLQGKCWKGSSFTRRTLVKKDSVGRNEKNIGEERKITESPKS